MHNQEEEGGGGGGGGEKDFSASFRVDSPTMIPAAAAAAAADRSFDQHDHSSTSSADDEGEEEEFEFSFLGRDSADAAAGAADEIFANGQIRPVYPLFDRKLLDDHIRSSSPPPADDGTKHVRLSLRKLFLDERSTSFSSSSSSSSSTSTSSEKDDELEGVPEGTYCVWTPKASAEQKRCKKSGSTGSTTTTTSASSSSKLRLKIRDLVIGRSQSYGKQKFLFIPNTSNNNEGKRTAGNGGGGDDGNRKTFLPYKQDLVGLFSSVNAISRTHHPF